MGTSREKLDFSLSRTHINMNFSIRQATPNDAAIIARFNALMAVETESKTLDAELLQKGVEALLADPSKGLYFLAESEGRVVGQTMITYEWSDWRNGTFWWIQSVYVAKEARGTGVFKALFEYIHSLATSRPDICGLRLYVEENNTRARQTYERLGMKHSHYRMYEMDFVL
jgi:GNAT superfamily N-acetyltransferase